MKNESKSLRKLIVACAALCTLFVAFISYQSWGTLENMSLLTSRATWQMCNGLE